MTRRFSGRKDPDFILALYRSEFSERRLDKLYILYSSMVLYAVLLSAVPKDNLASERNLGNTTQDYYRTTVLSRTVIHETSALAPIAAWTTGPVVHG